MAKPHAKEPVMSSHSNVVTAQPPMNARVGPNSSWNGSSPPATATDCASPLPEIVIHEMNV